MPVLIKLPDFELPSWLRRLADLGRRVSNVLPTTFLGALVGGLSALALWRWGYGQMDLLIFVFGLSGLALLALACLFTSGSFFYLRRWLGRNPQLLKAPLPGIETGSPTETDFYLPSLGGVPLVKIRWTWRAPERVVCRTRWREGKLFEEVVADRRCRVSAVEREIEVRDAFGLSRLAWRCRQTVPLTILPHIGRLGSMPRLQSVSSAEGLPHPSGDPEGDRMEIRRYVPGDPVRHILWKAYARTRQLNVRVPERAVDRSQRIVAYLLTSSADGAAAAAARMALQSDLLGTDWLFAADGFPEPTDDLAKGLAAVAASGTTATSRRRPADGLRAFLARPEVSAESHCVVFAAAEPGPWVEDLIQASRGFGGVTSVVLGTDGVREAKARPWWHRFLFAEEGDVDRRITGRGQGIAGPPAGRAGAGAAGRTTAEDLTELMGTLHAARHPAMVVDRSSGRSHGRVDSQSLTAAGVGAASHFNADVNLGRTG